MNKFTKLIVSGVISISCYGCGTTVTKGPSYSELGSVQIKRDHALLFVFRQYAEPTAIGSTIYVDDQEVTKLSQSGFTWLYLKPGSRNIVSKWPTFLSGQENSNLLLNAKANTSYYIDLTGVSRLSGSSGSLLLAKVGTSLNIIKPEEAKKRLKACCKLQKAKKSIY